MSLNKLTTTNIRENFNLGAGDIKCNELFMNNLKYNIFTKTKFTPVLYINDESTVPSIFINESYFYTTGAHLVLFGNLEFTYSGASLPPPNLYLTLPSDFEDKVGATLVSNNSTVAGIVPPNIQQNFLAAYESFISLTPLNNLPSLRLRMVDEQGGGNFSTSVYTLVFQCIFEL